MLKQTTYIHFNDTNKQNILKDSKVPNPWVIEQKIYRKKGKGRKNKHERKCDPRNNHILIEMRQSLIVSREHSPDNEQIPEGIHSAKSSVLLFFYACIPVKT